MSEQPLPLSVGQPSHFTLGAAAKAAKVSKPSLSKAISSGRLSAEKQPDGSYRIQTAELFRVYPPATHGNGLDRGHVVVSETGSGNQLAESEVGVLHERLAVLTAERERERQQLSDQIADLRRRLDAEAEERRRLTALLTDQRPVKPRRRWWQRWKSAE